jgi:hypothetical protein
MTFPQTLIPYLALVPYAAMALCLVVTLGLFVSLKLEVERNARRERKRVDDMLGRIETVAEGHDAVYVPVSVAPSFHRNRRVQATRLLRKGEDIAHVAAALSMPRAEVELLARVIGIAQGPLDPATSPERAAAATAE